MFSYFVIISHIFLGNSSNLTTSQYETVLNVKRNLNLQREGIAESPPRITPFMQESTLQLDTNVSVVKKNVNLAQEIMTKSDSFIPPHNTCSSSQRKKSVIFCKFWLTLFFLQNILK